MKPIVERLDHLVLTVADIEATCEFYGRILHMETITFAGGRKALTFSQQKINLHCATSRKKQRIGLQGGLPG